MQPIGGKITALFTARSPINRNPADNGVADWSVSSADVSKRLVIRNRIIDRSSILPATDPRVSQSRRVSIFPRRRGWKKGERQRIISGRGADRISIHSSNHPHRFSKSSLQTRSTIRARYAFTRILDEREAFPFRYLKSL